MLDRACNTTCWCGNVPGITVGSLILLAVPELEVAATFRVQMSTTGNCVDFFPLSDYGHE